MINLLEEVVSLYSNFVAPRESKPRFKWLGYGLAVVLLISSYGFGAFSLYNYLLPSLGKAWSSLILSLISISLSLLLLLVFYSLKPKPISSAALETLFKTIMTLKPGLKALKENFSLPKKTLTGLFFMLVGIYLYLQRQKRK